LISRIISKSEPIVFLAGFDQRHFALLTRKGIVVLHTHYPAITFSREKGGKEKIRKKGQVKI